MTVSVSCCISHYIPISTAFLYFQKDLALGANPFPALIISQFFYREERMATRWGIVGCGNFQQYWQSFTISKQIFPRLSAAKFNKFVNIVVAVTIKIYIAILMLIKTAIFIFKSRSYRRENQPRFCDSSWLP